MHGRKMKKQRVLFGKLQFCKAERLPYGLEDDQRQALLREVQTKHPAAHFDKRDKQLILYADWTPATPVQIAQHKLRIERRKQEKARNVLRIAALKERDFNRLVAKAKKLGYQLVPITG